MIVLQSRAFIGIIIFLKFFLLSGKKFRRGRFSKPISSFFAVHRPRHATINHIIS